jgi:hypothetical protein
MSGVGAVSSAFAGIQAAQVMASGAASDLAGASGAGDVAGDVVTLSLASVQMAASVQVARAANDMQQTVLDLLKG